MDLRKLRLVNADALSAAGDRFELNLACREGKQRIVLASAYVYAGMNVGSALAKNDVACDNQLTVCLLHAEALGFGITAVLGGTYTFFMSKKL